MHRNKLVLNIQILLALKFDPHDLDLMVTLCETLLEAGKFERALKFSDAVLEKVSVFSSLISDPSCHQDPGNVRGLVVRAECLKSFCKIEQAHLVYVRALKYSPGSKQLSKKIKECQETIFGKLGNEETFVFKGSTIFFDYLRDMGYRSIDIYLLEDNAKLSLNKLANMMSGLKKKPFGVKDSIWKEKDKKAIKVNFDDIIKRKKKTVLEKKKCLKNHL